MKKILLFVLLFSNTFQIQSIFSQTSENQLDYYKSNPGELFDEGGNRIFNSNEQDSLVFTGEIIENYFGRNVSKAGDVNGDGYSDIIISAPNYNFGVGRVFLFYGGSLMDNVADLILTGETENSFGASISSAGDVNGDGFSDIIIGAPDYNNLTSNEARTYIFYGGSNMNNIADVILIGNINNFSISVSSAGDVNGDGYSDVIVGSHFEGGNGLAYIFFGGSSMNSIADIVLSVDANSNNFGYSVSSAGDVNGDGFSDVIVGALTYVGENRTGEAFIFYGGSSMNNIADVKMSGETQDGLFGFSVSSAGDVNGDGYSDVIVGAVYYNITYGRAYIYYGSPLMNNTPDVVMTGDVNNYLGNSVSSAGDVNGDGFSDVIVGCNHFNSGIGRAYIYYGNSSMNNVADIVLNGEGVNTDFGVSVSSAGGINGDGYSDVIVGASSYSTAKGRAYLYTNLIPKPELINPINNSINNPLTVNFNWKKFNSALYYILLISTDSVFSNIIVNDTIYTDTSKVKNGFQKGLKYYWKIRVKDTLGVMKNSSIWNFITIPPLYTNIKLLFEGMYSPAFNQLIRKDSVTAYLRQSNSPFNILDSAKSTIDSNSFTGSFIFYNASSGIYYISIKHLNSIETWSKAGGENLITNGTIYYYDFTAASSQAYGNNLKLKGSKYCLFSGDVNQDGFITLFDVIPIYNDASSFITGRFLATDLTGDIIVDLTDVTLCYNNSTSFVRIRRP